MKDQIAKQIIINEEKRQNEYVELIASENIVSEDVMEAVGSVLTNKYAEGYSGKRYYGGCEVIDEAENLAIKRLTKIFNAKYANVQPHSGSQANQAVYMALLNPGDKIMGMSLAAGGHLTHGHHVSSSGIFFEAVQYGVNPETEMLDYEEIREIALREKPKLIICGASAYPREIDFSKFREIADEVGAYLMADVAHIAGLIVAGIHQNPMEYADVVTSTTHKTLRGPRGGIILTNNEEIAQKVDKALFPGLQGGPLMHVILGKAVAFGEADTEEYKDYIRTLVENNISMAEKFKELGARVTTGGSDNHLFLLDVKSSYGISGKDAEALLFKANIIVNKNTIPNDTESPFITSGIRVGTAAMTTHGFTKDDFIKLAEIMDDILKTNTEEKAIEYKETIKEMMRK
jgi:glycine hydroxymethyltransferase